ncbi:MAG: isoleucyl-tRNA synthetase [Actinomycetota bacterium]|jgi:isoleucyl-tRNA synthetase|nr:isoleucyl-tRNA synthetase [Actinomycetota bacterium]
MLQAWRDKDVFHRSLKQREGNPEWVFYEGPPTANGKPGIHHVEARIFKDIFCRFQAMRGHYVHRKAGWDCHGLPVEIEVEKELGITRKRQIEEFGIEEFTKRCRESVQRYVDDWERLTERIGFWLDLDDAYWTMNPEYVETVWWILKQIWDKGLLEEDFKVVPYCPRCETSLSSHEQHQTGAYKMVTDPSVYVRFPLVDEPETSLLVWTTTPWTLLANMAAAVGPGITYAKVADPNFSDRFLIVAKERVEPLLGEGVAVVEEIAGRDLVDKRYDPPFDFVETGDKAHRVRPGDFVTTADGTGIVHLAPYGEDDMSVAKRDDLPITQMIDPSGRVVGSGGAFAGLWIKDADPAIIEDLKARSLLFKSEAYEHSYPHCWRCQTPLLYYPRLDWYIRTSQIRDELQRSNESTNWQPPTIKYGRFGDWLANNVDWSLSRDRYWGTPLPIWRCEEDHATCIGSFADLSERSGRDLTGFDPHRPYVDEITFPCPECGREATRVKSVIDTWFDSGSMPFGQWHYPFENEDVFKTRFPADFISEAIDQTRGWFYSLLAVSTLVQGENSYRNVVCLGHIVDGDGRKMSKSIGNIIDPWEVLDKQGADALRWYMLTGGTPWSARRVSIEIIEESLRKFLLTLWHTYSFWVTYASLESFDPQAETIAVKDRPEIDRWILAELDDSVAIVTASLEDFDATVAGRRIDRLVDDLSNWYVRRSRRRFWKSGEDADTRAAFQTLWECLVTIAQLIAPLTPYVADEIYTNLTGPISAAPDSVHLADWPATIEDRADPALRRRMALVRKLVTLGRSARTEAKVRVRQPLDRALVVIPASEQPDLVGLEGLVAEELNVKSVELVAGVGELVSYTVKPNFKALGPRFGSRMRSLAQAIEASDPAEIVHALERDGAAHIDVDGEQVSVTQDDLDVRIEGRAGFSLVQDGPYGVALHLELTPELEAEGMAREVVRGVQELRKSSGLAVEDRVELWLSSESDYVLDALAAHSDSISSEVLATSTHLDEASPPDASTTLIELDQGPVEVGLKKA